MLAVLAGRDVHDLLKRADKVGVVAVAGFRAAFLHGASAAKAGRSVLNAYRHDVFAHTDPGRGLKDPAEVVLVVIKTGGDGIQAHVFRGMLQDIRDDRFYAVVVAALFRFRQGDFAAVLSLIFHRNFQIYFCY